MQTTNQILTDLKTECNIAFGMLYKDYFNVVSRFITNNKGTIEDAEDTFQDTMIVLVNKLRQDNFILTASLKTYILAIAKYIWLKKIRTNTKKINFNDFHNSILYEEINISIEQEQTSWDKFQHYFHKITEHCKGLIHDMFFKEKSIQQIQQQYGYTSIHNAQNQKHKCVEQIRKVKEKEENKK